MIRILNGDCRARLAELPDQSVHCCVTSPPYFGLRDYGTAQWSGGDTDCDHAANVSPRASRATNGLTGGTSTVDAGTIRRGDCTKCGATRTDSQIGLEPTPDAYVAELVAVFREVKRVLRDDGTLWLNLGDSYASGGGTGVQGGRGQRFDRRHTQEFLGNTRAWPDAGFKPKDLIGIPWMVAFALRADGWYLRSDIIWAKPNPMPESVTDRPTSAHEHVFLLSKSQRYFYDADAVREPYSGPIYEGRANGAVMNGDRGDKGKTCGMSNEAGRNLRNVWTVATQPYAEAHFATFPPKLIEPCIKAGCPKGGTVLDPFGGAGTTGLVADRLGRDAILIELNPEYAMMAENRVRGDAGMFSKTEAR